MEGYAILVPTLSSLLTPDPALCCIMSVCSNRGTLFFRASMFTVGLALSLSVLGLSATLAGRLFGSVSARTDPCITTQRGNCPSWECHMAGH